MTIIYPLTGRGSFRSGSAANSGGTLSVDGSKLGRYYRAPAPTSPVPMPGLAGFNANKYKTNIGLNEYAVWRAVTAIQLVVKATPDGIFGPNTGKAVKTWQATQNIVDDGIVGSQTCEKIYRPKVLAQAKAVHPNDMPHLGLLCCGHIGYESGGWDPGAVSADCRDLGLGQINAFAHPEMNEFIRLDPISAIAFIVVFVADNIKAFPKNEDAQIAAYNLGRSGATDWIKAGSPDVWGNTDVRKYINNIHENMV